MSFPRERYQARQVLLPIGQYAAQDLTQAATTVIGKFVIPNEWQSANLHAMGWHFAETGGAESVIASVGISLLPAGGVIGTIKDGQPTPVAFTMKSVTAHVIWSCVETGLNQAVGAPKNAIPALVVPAPVFPTMGPGDMVSLIILTAGVTAGAITVYPYLLVTENPATPDLSGG